MSVQWTSDQKNAITSRNGALLVSAAAGSGKTAVLVERLLRFVQDEGYDIDKFLMITYTNAAAGELRAKIIDALSKRVAENPEDRHLARQMNVVHRASISTIHAFCTQLLRTHGHYINVSSDFKIIDENESNMLRRQVLEEILDEKYESNEPSFLTLCSMLISGSNDWQLVEAILDVHSKSRTHPNPEEWLSKCTNMYRNGCDVWEKEIMDYVSELCDYYDVRIQKIINAIGCDGALDAAYTPVLLKDREHIMALKGKTVWDEFYAAAENISFSNLTPARGCDEDLREWAKGERKAIKEKIENICAKFICKDKETIDRELVLLAPTVEELCSIAGELNRRFTELKLKRAVMDYSDLEHETIKLLIDSYDEEEDRVVPTSLAREISENFREIMVDEYQDSNCIQDIIFRAISKDEKNLTMVGDLKQSIYRFRLADPTIFLRKYKSFKNYDEAKDGDARVVNLAMNFRSRTEVLDTCNKFFSETMTERVGELDYTQREYLNPRDNIPETEMNCQSEFVVVNLKEAESTDGKSSRKIEAEYIASRIKQMNEEGVPYEDIVILLRSQAKKALFYENALRRYGIPCVSEKKEGILTTVEVNVLYSFLQVIDNPLWDVPIVSVLRSPLFAFTADELAYVRRHKRGNFYHALIETAKDEGELAEKARGFLSLLTEFRDLANEIGTDELIWYIMDKTGARGLFGAMNGGKARVANLNEFYNYAVRFEREEFRGLHTFLNHIAFLTEHEKDIEGDNSESSMGAVRIMSIHKSKGLEFPIVFIADCGRQFNEMDLQQQVISHPKLGLGLFYRDNKLRYESPSVARNCITLALKNELRSEELRVMYVAMTRAKDKLIMTCTEKDADDRINTAKNSVPDGKVSPIDLLNSFRMDMWFLLPLAVNPDMFKLKIVEVSEIAPPEDKKNTDSDDAPAISSQVDELRNRFDFVYPYDEAVHSEGKLTATGIAHESMSVHRHFYRPRFEQKIGLTATEKGIAIHLVMQFIDFEKCTTKKGVEEEIRRLFEMEYLTKEQFEVIPAGKIYGFFQSELGRIALSSECRREFNFSRLVSLENGDSALLQGVVDLIIHCDDGIIIVDFKSDSTINDNNVGQYKRQLQVYKESLEAILDTKVKACYLYFLQQEKTIKM